MPKKLGRGRMLQSCTLKIHSPDEYNSFDYLEGRQAKKCGYKARALKSESRIIGKSKTKRVYNPYCTIQRGHCVTRFPNLSMIQFHITGQTDEKWRKQQVEVLKAQKG